MRKITEKIISSFYHGEKKIISNTRTDGKSIWLHENEIVRIKNGRIEITNAGWPTNTTKERLNGLAGVNIHQKDFIWYLNDKEWNGSWIKIPE